MFRKTLMALAIASLTVPALAAVSADEAKQLGTTLTPIGAEKAGNKDGTIPAWTGGMCAPPAGWTPEKGYLDPFPNDKIKFTITKANAAQSTADYRRTEGLAQAGVMSQQQLDLAKATSESNDAQVSAAQSAVTQAAAQGNAKALDGMVASDFFAIDSDGNPETRDTILNRLRTNPWRVKSLQQQNVQIHLYGETAVATGVDQVEARDAAGRDRSGVYRFLHVFQKRNGRWWLIAAFISASSCRLSPEKERATKVAPSSIASAQRSMAGRSFTTPFFSVDPTSAMGDNCPLVRP